MINHAHLFVLDNYIISIHRINRIRGSNYYYNCIDNCRCLRNSKISRTTNHLEEWHAALNKAVRRPKPNFFYFDQRTKKKPPINYEFDLKAQKNCNRPPKTKN